MSAADIPPTLATGAVLETTANGECVVVVGSAPAGLPVILSPKGWRMLGRWKLDHLVLRAGRVCATGQGYSGYPHVARLITGVIGDTTKVVEHRNGNLLDLRESNLVVLPRSLKIYAERQRRAPEPPPELSRLKTSSVGRISSRQEHRMPNALQRYEALVHGKPLPDSNWQVPPHWQPTHSIKHSKPGSEPDTQTEESDHD